MGQLAEMKPDRMHLLLDTKTKRKLERAPAAADRVIDLHENIMLPATDWDVFYDALINPPEPNEKLQEAVRRYCERIGR